VTLNNCVYQDGDETLKRPGRQADHSSSPSAAVKNA